MGKNSLIKSTAKKKKKTEEVEKTKISAEEKPIAKPEAPPMPKVSTAKKKVPAVKKPTPDVTPKPKKETAKTSSAQKPDVEKATPAVTPKPPEPESPVTITYETSSAPEIKDPRDYTLWVLAGCILFLLFLVIGASAANTSRYYIKEKPMGVEIWQGKFAPLGEKKIIVLPDTQAPEEKKAVYYQNDVYPLIFNHYLNKADALLVQPGMPDYESIKAHLIQAQAYAANNQLATAASKRLVAIDFSNLLYRANIAGSGKTVEELEKALDYLSQASQLKLEPVQLDQIVQQREMVTEKLIDLREIQPTNE